MLNVIDLAGNSLQEKHINYGAQMIVENYGVPTDLFLPFEVYGQFAQEFLDRQRIQMPSPGTNTAGTVVDKYNTHGGPVNMEPNIFLKKTKALPTQAHPKAPSKPATVTAALNGTANGAEFGKSGAGAYKYYVTAANKHGESLPTELTATGTPATIAITGGDLAKSVNVTVTNAGSSVYPVDYLVVYRTEKDGTDAYQIARVAVTSAAGSATTVVTDKNATMPNTFTAFMGEMSEQILAFKQLAPMMKMDLATLAPSYRWMILLYGVPVLYAPKKWMRFKNIKAQFTV
jgi:hypothetical protein